MPKRLWFALLRWVRRTLGLTRVYYVGDDGDDARDGLTVSTAKRTLRAAVDASNPGDRIMCLPKA